MATIIELISNNNGTKELVGELIEEGLNVEVPENEGMFMELAPEEELNMLGNSGVFKSSFTGREVAGQKITYRWNRYGQLEAKLKGIKIKGTTKGALMERLYWNHSKRINFEDRGVWSIQEAVLFPGAKEIHGFFVLRLNKVIGFFKSKESATVSIEWWSKNVYRDFNKSLLVPGKIVDFIPESENEIYDSQEFPEFTREEELEEIRAFVESLGHRHLSVEEVDLLTAIREEINRLL